MTIVSASRRTDIPAHYSEWFRRRVRAGVAWARNPFNGRPYAVSLRPDAVTAFVFWSRDYRPMLGDIAQLDAAGYASIFHFTITGLPRELEPGGPDVAEAIETLRTLAGRVGPRRVLWRYDPVVLSDRTDEQYHVRRFQWLLERLAGCTRRCIISFPTWYAKVRGRMARLAQAWGVRFDDAPDACRRRELACRLAERAAPCGIDVSVCCDPEATGGIVQRARCIDAELLGDLYPARRGPAIARAPTRPGCGCWASRDIGAYDTCPRGCVYCYANDTPQRVARALARHDPAHDFLVR